MEFSIIIVLHESGDVIEEALASAPRACEVVVIDNASTDHAEEIVTRVRPDARYLRLTVNRGFGAGCNEGARRATGDMFVFLNPDTKPQPGAIERLVASVRDDPWAVVGPALLERDGRTRYVCRRRSIPLHEVMDLIPLAGRFAPERWRRNLPMHSPIYEEGGVVDYLQGACIAVSRDLFASIGGFDESFFLYSEEEDLCDRARAAGARCVYNPSAAVVHDWGTSTRKTGTWADRQRYRSSVLLYRKRYGTIVGNAAALAIGAAVVVRLIFLPFAWLSGHPDSRGPRWALDCIRGLASAALVDMGKVTGERAH